MLFMNPLLGLHGIGVLHGGSGVQDAWVSRLTTDGFEVIERGRAPGTAYFLARKPGGFERE